MDNFIGSALLLVVGGLIVLFVYTLAGRKRAMRRRTYDTVARRYSGYAYTPHLFARPMMRIPYGDCSVLVSTLRIRGQEVSQVQMDWDNRRFHLEVSTPLLERPTSFRGNKAFETDQTVANKWLVKTNDSAAATQILTSGVVWQIERIQQFSEPHEIFVAIHRGNLLVRRAKFMFQADALDEFIRGALGLYDQCVLTQSEGIDFVGSMDAQLIEDPICQICHESIVEEIVFCVRCQTAHCRECWHYTGVCSTFACGETRYSQPLVAKPLEPKTSNSDE